MFFRRPRGNRPKHFDLNNKNRIKNPAENSSGKMQRKNPAKKSGGKIQRKNPVEKFNGKIQIMLKSHMFFRKKIMCENSTSHFLRFSLSNFPYFVD